MLGENFGFLLTTFYLLLTEQKVSLIGPIPVVSLAALLWPLTKAAAVIAAGNLSSLVVS